MRARTLQYDPLRKIYQPKMTEEHVLLQIRQYLEFNGARVYRIAERIPKRVNGRIVGRISEGGFPDLCGYFPLLPALVLAPGEFTGPPVWFIEVKAPGGKRRPKQEEFIREAQGSGLIAFFAESVDQVRESFAARGIRLKG